MNERSRDGSFSTLFAWTDTCAVSDALDRLGLSGTVHGLAPLTVAQRIVGRVVTVELGPATSEPSTRHLCTSAIESSGPGDVVVVSHDARLQCAGWGGLLSVAALSRRIEGVVVDGPVRDVDESRGHGFPVYARSAVPTTARGRAREVSWNQAIYVAGVTVRPGDAVVADSSGVVFVDSAHVGEVAEVARAIAAREAAMAAAIWRGEAASAVMGGSYEQLTRVAES